MSAFDHTRSIAPQQLRPGLISRAVHGASMTLGLIELDPGTELPEHHHENEQIGLLIDGSLTFTVGEEVAELAPGATWCILANVPHSVIAGPGGAVLVEAFAPHRDDWVALDTLEPARPVAVASRLEILERAKLPLDRLSLYPRPVRVDRVRLIVAPLLFRLPWLRRFDGYAAWHTILLRESALLDDHDLVCHELCHVWQMQHRPFAMPLSYLRAGYAGNRYEAEARQAVEATRG